MNDEDCSFQTLPRTFFPFSGTLLPPTTVNTIGRPNKEEHVIRGVEAGAPAGSKKASLPAAPAEKLGQSEKKSNACPPPPPPPPSYLLSPCLAQWDVDLAAAQEEGEEVHRTAQRQEAEYRTPGGPARPVEGDMKAGDGGRMCLDVAHGQSSCVSCRRTWGSIQWVAVK